MREGQISSLRELFEGNFLFLTLSRVLKTITKFITFPYFSLYVRALGGSNVVIGLIGSLTPLSAMFIYPIAGSLSDSYGRVKVIIGAGIIEIIIYIIYFIANDWRILALASFLTGFLYFQFPAQSALMADSIPIRSRGRGFALANAIPGLIGIFSPFIGGYLITRYGINHAMRLLYGATVLALILIQIINSKFLKEIVEVKPHASVGNIVRGSYKQIWETIKSFSRNLRWYALVLMTHMFFSSIAGSYWVIYAKDVIGLTEFEWGSILLAASIIPVLFSIPVGMLLDKFDKNKIIASAMIISTIPILVFPYASSFMDTLIIFISIATSEAFLFPGAMALLADLSPQENRGSTMAALGRGMLAMTGAGGGPGMGFLLTFPSVLGYLFGGLLYTSIGTFPWILLGISTIINALILAFTIKT